MTREAKGELSQYTREKARIETLCRLFVSLLIQANQTRVALESYYATLVSQHAEREERSRKLEERLRTEGLDDIECDRQRQMHAVKETEFLRLRRTRIGVADFESLKVT